VCALLYRTKGEGGDTSATWKPAGEKPCRTLNAQDTEKVSERRKREGEIKHPQKEMGCQRIFAAQGKTFPL